MKPFWQSKTLWFNALTMAVEVVQALGDARVIDANTLVVVAAAGNALLRVLTTQSVGIQHD